MYLPDGRENKKWRKPVRYIILIPSKKHTGTHNILSLQIKTLFLYSTGRKGEDLAL